MTNEEIKKALSTCVEISCEGCPYIGHNPMTCGYSCSEKVKIDARNLITEQEKEIETLKNALTWYMNMYGCKPERNVYDDKVEYSCNGYVTDKEEATALLKAKKELGWVD